MAQRGLRGSSSVPPEHTDDAPDALLSHLQALASTRQLQQSPEQSRQPQQPQQPHESHVRLSERIRVQFGHLSPLQLAAVEGPAAGSPMQLAVMAGPAAGRPQAELAWYGEPPEFPPKPATGPAAKAAAGAAIKTAAGAAPKTAAREAAGANKDELITLNDGGKLFRTTRATLTKHPDSMLAAMFRWDMRASGLRDEQGHPFLDRDPTHFLFILAYLRDGRVPPLPQGLLELQQLRVEAEFYTMAELAEAAAAAVAAIQARSEAAQQLEAVRAAPVLAASQAVERAQAEHDAAKAKLAPLRAARRECERLAGVLDEVRRNDDGGPAGRESIRILGGRLAEAQNKAHGLYYDLHSERYCEAQAAKRLRNALLARLCALGADLPAAQAQLKATHPELAKS